MYLKAENITKHYDNRQVLNKCCLEIHAGVTLSILGKSGCGKSTLLKIIAGLETLDSGAVLLNDINISGTKPNERGIVYLFQEALLFPHLNVYDNIAFGLRIRRQKEAAIQQKVHTLIAQLELGGEEKKFPEQLSGGQKQRVAFGRALVINPPLLLLDEPFSSLDAETRTGMQQLFKSISAAYQITALFVTHDLKEALIMGDEYAYMQNGQLTIYKERVDFISDKKTGVGKEIDFWNTLK